MQREIPPLLLPPLAGPKGAVSRTPRPLHCFLKFDRRREAWEKIKPAAGTRRRDSIVRGADSVRAIGRRSKLLARILVSVSSFAVRTSAPSVRYHGMLLTLLVCWQGLSHICLWSFLRSFPNRKQYQYIATHVWYFGQSTSSTPPATSTTLIKNQLHLTILLNIQLRRATWLNLAPRQLGLHHIPQNSMEKGNYPMNRENRLLQYLQLNQLSLRSNQSEFEGLRKRGI